MKAVRIHNYGDASVLSYEDAPQPTAAAGELLIQVVATTANPFDYAARAGYLAGWYAFTFPVTLGLDVSGIVEAVGEGVTDFAQGDEVFARADPAKNGAYAEYIVLPASEAAHKPASIDHFQAAALPHVGFTAWRALIDVGGLTSGQTVLIHGAAGGVGSLAVQLAKWRGAKVIGTSSANNIDFLQELGVDEAIDYNAMPFESMVREVDLVLDTVGGDTLERSWGVLKPGGMLLSVVQPPAEETAAAHSVHQAFVTAVPPAGQTLGILAALVDSGDIKPVVSSVLPLSDVQQAHALGEGRHVRGKIVLKVSA
ncbi:MAG: NADP-dependent oxidoreductase [Anaerolineaceae bacterium]|nr:NADP-dependent oxidoreductase [Anaerolineaceae bacterium]